MADAPNLAERLQGIVGRLEGIATKRVGDRQSLEKRWIEDLEQYWGKYDADTFKRLKEGEKSKLFINLTGPKTDAVSARLMDLLFPTDDKNWGIGPTPVPQLMEDAKRSADAARQLAQQAQQAQERAAQQQDPAAAQQVKALEDQAKAAATKAAEIQTELDEAARRAELMEAEIDDQLKESLYPAVMRDVVDQSCKLGTGVAKGPVTGDLVRKGWKKQQAIGLDGAPREEYGLQMSEGTQPAMRFVDVWSFFPDMDVARIEESQGVFERHLMNKKRLRKLADLPGFNKDGIRRLLREKARSSAPAYLADLRNITGDNQQIAGDLYHVWEYTGPLDAEDMRDLAMAVSDDATVQDLEEVDPIKELNAIVWFCQGEVLKFAIYPYDSGECMYSVFNLKKDESSIFGYGIPAIIRDPQKSLNAGWRAMMDNAGLASGPQIVLARDLIEPADGDWSIRPRKVWIAKQGLPQDRRAFATFDIPMRQQELAAIIDISRQFLDDMASMPQIAQGEQGAGVTKTAQGMALLMNSANVVFRRIVKNFDDDMTTPNIRRFYDWNMQFGKKQEIKGDYCVDARGSSVLLVREMQAQNLMTIAVQLGAHPVYGPMLKNKGVLKKLFQSHMIPVADVMLTDDEIDAIMMSAQAQQPDPAAEAKAAETQLRQTELEIKVEMANMENASKLQIAKIQHDTALIKMAETMNMSLDKIEGMLQAKREEHASRERIVAAEAAMAQRTGQQGAGGGYI